MSMSRRLNLHMNDAMWEALRKLAVRLTRETGQPHSEPDAARWAIEAATGKKVKS